MAALFSEINVQLPSAIIVFLAFKHELIDYFSFQFTMTEPNSSKTRPSSSASSKKSFCSERCFSHYRRAAFKKNKACDWCRKKNEGTIIDGDTQLQFCK
jgi:hypothetical protein